MVHLPMKQHLKIVLDHIKVWFDHSELMSFQKNYQDDSFIKLYTTIYPVIGLLILSIMDYWERLILNLLKNHINLK